MSSDQWYMITPNGFLSALIWILILVAVLFLARDPAHKVIHSVFRALTSACKVATDAILGAHEAVLARNREVLLAQGREEAERDILREFERIDASVRRDLGKYPALQRQISEEIAHIEEEFAASSIAPPTPPSWIKAVEAVANIPSNGDPMVAKTLEIIHASLLEGQKRAEVDYRNESQKRHNSLSGMTPSWRRVMHALEGVDKNINSLLDRAGTIDRHMDNYQQIVAGDEAARNKLASSSMVKFAIAALVMAIAVGAAALNFSLIAHPMSEVVGGGVIGGMIGGFETADIAAFVIVLVEISMGLFLMESLKITRLFPVIGALSDRLRTKMMWGALAVLVVLACVGAGLAYMREFLLQDEVASLAWIMTGAQMALGFILPFALISVAIPLETFVHSLRSVVGVATAWTLKGLAFVFHMLGRVFDNSSQVLGEIYDMIIFLPNLIGQKFNFGYADVGNVGLGNAELSTPGVDSDLGSGFGKVDFGNAEIDAETDAEVHGDEGGEEGDIDGAATLSDALIARGRKQVDLAEQGKWN